MLKRRAEPSYFAHVQELLILGYRHHYVSFILLNHNLLFITKLLLQNAYCSAWPQLTKVYELEVSTR